MPAEVQYLGPQRLVRQPAGDDQRRWVRNALDLVENIFPRAVIGQLHVRKDSTDTFEAGSGTLAGEGSQEPQPVIRACKYVFEYYAIFSARHHCQDCLLAG